MLQNLKLIQLPINCCHHLKHGKQDLSCLAAWDSGLSKFNTQKAAQQHSPSSWNEPVSSCNLHYPGHCTHNQLPPRLSGLNFHNCKHLIWGCFVNAEHWPGVAQPSHKCIQTARLPQARTRSSVQEEHRYSPSKILHLTSSLFCIPFKTYRLLTFTTYLGMKFQVYIPIAQWAC